MYGQVTGKAANSGQRIGGQGSKGAGEQKNRCQVTGDSKNSYQLLANS